VVRASDSDLSQVRFPVFTLPGNDSGQVASVTKQYNLASMYRSRDGDALAALRLER